MSIWTRIANVFRGDRLNREIDEELEAHLANAVAEGRDEAEARRALGAALRIREESRDLRLLPWLDSLRADAVLGWRQLMKRKVTSASAILPVAGPGHWCLYSGLPAGRRLAAATPAGG